MKLNKLFTAVSVMALMGSTQAAPNLQGSPKLQLDINNSAAQQQHRHHGVESAKRNSIDEARDDRSPAAQSVYKPTANSSLKSAAAVACDLNAMTTSNTNTLISELKTQGSSCINELFSAASGTQSAVYTSTKMIAVADHVRGLSNNYAGGGDDNIEALFLFLRAGYYVEFYNNNVTFSSSVKPAVKNAIDAFVNNSHFYDDNDLHGKTLGEVMITMDSSEQQDVYVSVAKEWLSRWNQSYASKWYMRSSVNNAFTLIFRGQWNANFVAAVGNDTTLVARLRDFALSSWMVGHDAEFMASNAARELGRLKTYSGTAIQSSVDAGLNNIFSTYQMYGTGDAIWLGAADTATYYADCATYNICGYKAQLEATVLSQTHTCSSTIKIRSQNLTAVQQASACSTMGAEETYFHNKLQTGNQPVGNDNNSQLQINIFDSSDDYGKYAGAIFGIGTNNGGMYLEGDPSVPGNVPNFIAYEASYANADHYIWNLEHEYVHYLDGRFDLYGDFNAPTERTVWWSEGVAEYVANQDNNQAAIDTTKDGSVYTLGEVFETTYDGFDQDRIYRWGYLAVRFMFERHQNEVNSMLASTRTGDWAGYKSRVNSWASAYNNEFVQWYQAIGPIPGENVKPVAVAAGPYSGQPNTAIALDGSGSYDTDGSVNTYSWSFSDGGSASGANASYTFSSVGNYTATLTVTDNLGLASDPVSVAVNVSADPVGNVLNNGQTVNISGAQDSETRYTMDVPAGATDLIFTIIGGSGDADLYVQQGSAPTTGTYDCRPWLGGNNETCAIANVQSGTYHVMVRAYNAYSNVGLTGSFTGSVNGNVPDACATSGPVTSGSLVDGEPLCLGNQDPIWLTIGGVNSHSSIAISSGNGTGDIDVHYQNGTWPAASRNDGDSTNTGNSECIYLTNTGTDYWGYFKITGNADGASIVVDFDTAGCR